MSIIYLDNNATTRVHPQVVEAIQPWIYEHFGNPSSSHSLGQQAKEALIQARAEVAKFLAASPAEIIFTSGATESNHMAIHSALAMYPERNTIVTSQVEHPSTLQLLEYLSEQGVNVVYIPVNTKGELDMQALKAAIDANTALVSLMHANNETGVLFPIAEVAALAHHSGALFHTDAAQTAGKLALNVKALDCDMLSFSGHKLHAPKGVGVLFMRKNITAKPMLYGHQERKRRGGTENLTGIIGLGVACRVSQMQLNDVAHNISALRDRLQAGILKQLPYVKVNGDGHKVHNTTNLSFSGISGEELLYKLDKVGIIASQGSACVAGGKDPSHVLLAMGLNRDEALSSVRFSLSEETTEAEIETAIECIVAVVKEITHSAALVA
ncbi:MAG: aminotransferase class V-fold PLP-dependent enzyme [Methylophilus sp.]|nr:aminotransferase class V-fold PLP-dependent enzyme [Methylophilus sp.]